MSKKRLIQLDLLRFLAIFLVLGRHADICPPEINRLVHHISVFWFNGGWLGVDLFFVLSGFLVSGLIFREYRKFGKVEIKRFLIRRGFKIYPSFWLFLITTIVINKVISRPLPIKDLAGEILFLQNYVGRLWNHTWSLAVEEHFYIGLAVLVFLLLRFVKNHNKFAYIPLIFLFIAITCFTLRLLMATFKGVNTFPTHFRIDSLFFGVLISYYWNFHGLSDNKFLKTWRYYIAILGVVILSPFFLFDSSSAPSVFVFGFTFIYIGSGLLLISFLKIDFGDGKLIRSLSYIGTYSYSIYLWHMLIKKDVLPIVGEYLNSQNWLLLEGVYILLSIFIGMLLSKLVEYPILRLRDKLYPFRSVAVTR